MNLRQLFSYIDRVDEFDVKIFGSLSFYSLPYTEHRLADHWKFKDLALHFARVDFPIERWYRNSVEVELTFLNKKDSALLVKSRLKSMAMNIAT